MCPRIFFFYLCSCLSGTALCAESFETPDCIILPDLDIALSSASQGQLARVLVEEAETVTAGQVVAELTSDIEAANLAIAREIAADDSAVQMARTRLDYDHELLQSAETLSDRSIMSSQMLAERRANYQLRESELRQAEAAMSRAQLEVGRAEAQLESRRIRSPIDGVVLERLLDPGEFLREDTPLMRLGKLDVLRVEVILPQHVYRKVEPQMAIRIAPEIAELPEATAHIQTVDAIIDAASGTFGVSAQIDTPGAGLVAGINCLASFDYP